MVSLIVGNTVYPLADVIAVILGQDMSGASFTVGRLRLPRAVLAVVAGASFGLAGVSFQTLLRNPLASPDVIGISAGASAAAAFAIVVLSVSGAAVSVIAIAAGLIVALIIYALASRSGVAGTRLILIGIGVAAMLESVTAYVLSQAGQWDLQEAVRWLSGSLNGANWQQNLPVVLALAILVRCCCPSRTASRPCASAEDASGALGVRVERTRLIVVVTAVGLIAFATAAAGPIAFVAFLSGLLPRASSARAGQCSSPPPSSVLCSCWQPISSVSTPSEPGSRSVSSPGAGSAVPDLPHRPDQQNRRLPVTLTHTLTTEHLTLGYADRTVVDDLDLRIPRGRSPSSSAPMRAGSPRCCARCPVS